MDPDPKSPGYPAFHQASDKLFPEEGVMIHTLKTSGSLMNKFLFPFQKNQADLWALFVNLCSDGRE